LASSTVWWCRWCRRRRRSCARSPTASTTARSRRPSRRRWWWATLSGGPTDHQDRSLGSSSNRPGGGRRAPSRSSDPFRGNGVTIAGEQAAEGPRGSEFAAVKRYNLIAMACGERNDSQAKRWPRSRCRQSEELIVQVVECVAGEFCKLPQALDRQGADLDIGVLGGAPGDEVPPGPVVPGGPRCASRWRWAAPRGRLAGLLAPQRRVGHVGEPLLEAGEQVVVGLDAGLVAARNCSCSSGRRRSRRARPSPRSRSGT
jgi:hypothetical protein